MNQTSSLSSGIGLAGFTHPTFDATAIFRTVLEAMSRPGQIKDLSPLCETPDALNVPASAILLALCDMETNVWLSPALNQTQVIEFLSFHTGCKVVNTVTNSVYAVLDGNTSLDELTDTPVGTAEFPDRSATLLILVNEINNEATLTLRGPGILDTQPLNVGPLPEGFWPWRAEQNQNFPCGIDVIFASPTQICALPRTTKVEF